VSLEVFLTIQNLATDRTRETLVFWWSERC